MSHTPGPWRASQSVNQYDLHIAEVYHGRTAIIADGRGDRWASPDFDESGDNARLIAAAPELLAAIKLTAAYFNDEGGVISYGTLRKTIDAAIAKAEEGAA